MGDMKRAAFRATTELTRAWVRLYTWQMAPHEASARRAEIDSDLWEMQHDAATWHGAAGTMMALLRLVRGVPADVLWRIEHAGIDDHLAQRRFVTISAAAAVVLAMWAIPALFGDGRRQVAACAEEATPPHETADPRFDIMRCAGAFFTSAR
jgi:hypothetical protein